MKMSLICTLIDRYTVYYCITFYVYITHTTDKFRVRRK